MVNFFKHSFNIIMNYTSNILMRRVKYLCIKGHDALKQIIDLHFTV